MEPQEYIPRHLTGQVREYLKQFPVVVVLGARQVGKTTLLAREFADWKRVDLEDAGIAQAIEADPALYLEDHPDNVWFDEAHQVPGLFPALRVAVDKDRRAGRYLLSGSATGALAAQVSESLAGRAGVLVLQPLGVSEILRRAPAGFLETLLQSEDAGIFAKQLWIRDLDSKQMLNQLWETGGFPEPVVLADAARRRRWFDSYVRLVSERDLVPTAGNRMGPVAARRLLRMLAARHGQPLNLSALARDFGTSTASIANFLDLLEGAFLWHRVEPYLSNIGKRLVRSPKGWVMDSGLLHALLDIQNWEELESHPSMGASFEGWVMQELMKAVGAADHRPQFYHWRTHAGAEVDIVLERGTRLYPIEVKRATRVSAYDLRGMSSFLSAYSAKAPFGIIVYRGELTRLGSNIVAVPVEAVL